MGVLQSCATLLSGTSDQVKFTSEPPGAEVWIDGKMYGETNNTIKVDRVYKFTEREVTYKLDGYEDVNFYYEVKVDPVYWLNIFLGFWPMVVDMATGAALAPKNDEYHKTLQKQ